MLSNLFVQFDFSFIDFQEAEHIAEASLEVKIVQSPRNEVEAPHRLERPLTRYFQAVTGLFLCPECEKSFKQSGSLQVHFDQVHGGAKFKCSF